MENETKHFYAIAKEFAPNDEDIRQEIVLKMWENQKNGLGLDIYDIARNVAKTENRKKKNSIEKPFENETLDVISPKTTDLEALQKEIEDTQMAIAGVAVLLILVEILQIIF